MYGQGQISNKTYIHFINVVLRKKFSDKVTSILNDESHYKIIQAIRQSGKTSMLTHLAYAYSQMNPFSSIAFCCIDQNNCDSVFYEIRNFLIGNPIERISKGKCIQYANGSSIHFTTMNSPDSLRGMAINLLIIDEMSYANSQLKLKEFLTSAMPCIYAQSNARVIIASTRKNRSRKKNVFWNLWMNAVEGIPCFGMEFQPFTINSKDCPHLSKKILVERKRNMSRSQYDTEYTLYTIRMR